MKAHLRKVGNSIGTIIPAACLRELNLTVGAELDIEAREGTIVIRPVQAKPKRLPFSEADLLAGLDAHTAHADELALPSNDEWTD